MREERRDERSRGGAVIAEVIPLSMARAGERVAIVEVRAGRGLSMRLATMGFYPGTLVEVISNIGRGPIIVAKGGIRLGLGFGMARKVFVRVAKESNGETR